MGQTAVIECMLGERSEDFLTNAIIATGKIYFEDNVDVSGRASSDDHTLYEADVVSNYDEDAPWGGGRPPVYWEESPGRNRLQGTVRSASSADNAINSDLKALATRALTDQAPNPVENVNIRRAIDAKSSVATGVPSVPGSPLSGDYYESGDLTVAGDIELDDANLYINGDLTVVGSIKGAGAVYVAGDTVFSGDSEVVANEEGVVLLSQGNVHLKGFDGTLWMDLRTSSSGRTQEWEETKLSFEMLRGHMNAFVDNPVFTAGANPQLAPPPGTPPITNSTADDYYWRSEAGLIVANLSSDLAPGFRPPGVSNTHLLNSMTDVLVGGSPVAPFDYSTHSESEQFMREKLRTLFVVPLPASGGYGLHGLGTHNGTWLSNQPNKKIFFEEYLETGRAPSGMLSIEFLLTAAVIYGESMGNARFVSYAGLTDDTLRQVLIKNAHWLDLFDWDRLGSAYFQGNIYTRGAIFASNEVTIIGSLSAVDDPEEPNTPWYPDERLGRPAHEPLRPGDVYLAAGTRILHLSELEPGPKPAFPPVGVRNWIR